MSPFISAFSAILFFRAFLLTSVLRIAHVTMPLAAIRIVEANTIHPPHPRCGTNNKISTKKASRVISKVGSNSMIKASKNLGECDGE